MIRNDDVGCARIVDVQHQHHRRRLRTIVDQLVATLISNEDLLGSQGRTSVARRRPDQFRRTLDAWRETDALPVAGFGGVGGDGDLDVHSQVVGRKPGPGAMERYRLARIAHHRDTNEVAVADDAAGWIEIDPTGSGQIDLSPGMGVAAAASSSSSGMCKYPETKRAAIPRERTASIISMARSRQLPLPSARVWSGL